MPKKWGYNDKNFLCNVYNTYNGKDTWKVKYTEYWFIKQPSITLKVKSLEQSLLYILQIKNILTNYVILHNNKIIKYL